MKKVNFMVEQFQEDLFKDERVLWTGQPETSVHLTRADVFLIPFSLLWGGFALFWEISVIAWGAPLIFPFVGGLFVLMGLYMIFGRFIYKYWKKKKTYYAVTNKRILILTKLWGRNFQTTYINSIPAINKSIRSDGIGTIKFGNPSFMASMYENTGMVFFGPPGIKDVPTFYDIKDANRVYEMANELREKINT